MNSAVDVVLSNLRSLSDPSLRWQVRRDEQGYLIIVDINTVIQRRATLAKVGIERARQPDHRPCFINDKLASFTHNTSSNLSRAVPATIDGETVLYISRQTLDQVCVERLSNDRPLEVRFFIEDVHGNRPPLEDRSPVKNFRLETN